MLEHAEKRAVLTGREQEIALLAARGLSNKSIAIELGLFEGTVKVHMHSIFGKLGVKTRWALMTAGPLPSRPTDFAA